MTVNNLPVHIDLPVALAGDGNPLDRSSVIGRVNPTEGQYSLGAGRGDSKTRRGKKQHIRVNGIRLTPCD